MDKKNRPSIFLMTGGDPARRAKRSPQAADHTVGPENDPTNCRGYDRGGGASRHRIRR
ncbi:MAG: hypothetical protein ABR884_03550 [Minisyncoccia bacterium]